MRKFVASIPQSISVVRIVSMLSIILSVALLITAIISNLLPLKYLVALILIIAVLDTLAIFALYIPKSKKPFRIIVSGAGVISIGIYCFGISNLIASMNLITAVTSNSSTIKKDIVETKPFNIFISGIDTYGDISTVSRSDVNIVASVNPQTKHIILTTIPRDSYVRIAGGGNNQYDKLTHAGNYGVLSSMQTAATLLNINIDTYTRINFTTFMDTIDEIDGVDVDNPIEFKTDSGQIFQRGIIHLNGKDALTFSRERHNLTGGDLDRGANQERVVTAIFNKISSPNILRSYTSVLNVLGKSIDTNISQASLTALVKQQLNDAGSWKIESASIDGKGQTGGLTSYAMPSSQLYMFVLNDQSLKQAQVRIQDNL